MPFQRPCGFCAKPSTLQCGSCRTVVYCSKEHQRAHWKAHKKECVDLKDLEVVEDNLGLHLITLKPVEEGKIILAEKPLILVPETDTPTCFGCCTAMDLMGPLRTCKSCGLLVCSEACEKSYDHLPECIMIVKHRKSKFTLGELEVLHKWVILILRCAYLKAHNKDAWAKVMNLRACSEQQRPKNYRNTAEFVAGFLDSNFGLKNIKISREEVFRLIDIFEMNKYLLTLCQAVYHKASAVEYHCHPNSDWDYFQMDKKIIFRAATDIEAGGRVTALVNKIPYETMNEGSIRKHMNMICRCQVCSTPSEPEYHMEAIRCTRLTCTGYIIPVLVALSSEYIWRCSVCQYLLPGSCLDYFSSLFDFIDNTYDLKAVEVYTSVLSRLFHPRSTAVLEAKEKWLKLLLVFNVRNLRTSDLETLFYVWDELSLAPPRFLQSRFKLRFLLYRVRYELLFEVISRGLNLPSGERMIGKLLDGIESAAESLLKFEPWNTADKNLLDSVRFTSGTLPRLLVDLEILRRHYGETRG